MASDPENGLSTGAAKRGRFEIRTIIAIVVAVMVIGAIWIAFNGSPTRSRAGIDSSANTTPTIDPQAPTTHKPAP